jgi:hypothetical protein
MAPGYPALSMKNCDDFVFGPCGVGGHNGLKKTKS